ncbi:MAG: cytochrome P450 [Gammaproteobacteria bacterium]|nr:cytochrome P450 [Gammaproteobacteria bacterium]MBP6051075.1 cytochrome P450 [Pseudomonadales bacterium]MBK6584179.1 cytochrome P450 [Gammaproteobacteria bacterium]MBK7168571.1 cytochrome P450 [Gammaproteobacteria bacterium]MBK7520363.1 cytochrome P450 [Gammaproteobacteria bacterium]
MKKQPEPDWDPAADDVQSNQCDAYDTMRRRCPVAYSNDLGWSVFRHADVMRILLDHETFSNVASSYRSVPNGMDPPEHTAYREAIEPYFDADRLRLFEPVCRATARALLADIPATEPVELIASFATPYSLHSQCAFLGWPRQGAASIRDWAQRSREARHRGDSERLAEIASEFRMQVGAVLDARRRVGNDAADDVIGGLLKTTVNGVQLADDDIASILRNWTVGELGSLASGIGIIAGQLAAGPVLQARLRAEPVLIPAAIEEILRACGPLVSNRRRATRDVVLGGRHISAGERVTVFWVAANRDDTVFESPDEVRVERDSRPNLLFGAGIHICPGAPLARLELRVAVEELLGHCGKIELADTPRRAVYPANGWASLPLKLS